MLRSRWLIIQAQPVTKKNSISLHVIKDRTGRSRIIPSPSKQYKEYEREALRQLPIDFQTIDYPVNVKAEFYMGTHRHVDLVNLQEALLDILVKAQVLKDDDSSIVESMDGSRVFYDKENPRTEVTITWEEA